MKVGDLVKMDFEDWPGGNEWGAGIIVALETSKISSTDDAEVLWPGMGLGWEMTSMLEVISEEKS